MDYRGEMRLTCLSLAVYCLLKSYQGDIDLYTCCGICDSKKNVIGLQYVQVWLKTAKIEMNLKSVFNVVLNLQEKEKQQSFNAVNFFEVLRVENNFILFNMN